MLIFDSTKQYVLNPDLKIIDSTNYLDTFLDIHIESFPIVTKYIEYRIYKRLSVYIKKYRLWEYKTYKIDNISYIAIPIKNILNFFPKIHKEITFYCITCYKRKSAILNRLSIHQKITFTKALCTNCLTAETLEKKYGQGITNVFQAEEIKEKSKKTSLEHYGTEYPSQSSKIRNKIINTNIKNWGCSCPLANKEIQEKGKRTCIEKYGSPSATASKEIQEKIKQTCIQKYGVDNATKTKEVREKMQKTCIERYGKPFAAQVEQFQEKMKNTCIKKYNVSCALLAEEVKEKRKRTMIERYGVASPQQSPKIREKTAKTKFRNDSVPTSKAQRYIFNLLKNNNENVALNYPFNTLSLDIVFLNTMICCEYDGSGHDLNVQIGRITREEFIKKERTRNYFIMSSGLKLIRIISKNDKLPNDNALLKMINLAKEYLLNTEHKWIYIDLNNQCFIFTKKHIKISFDSLKTIL